MNRNYISSGGLPALDKNGDLVRDENGDLIFPTTTEGVMRKIMEAAKEAAIIKFNNGTVSPSVSPNAPTR